MKKVILILAFLSLAACNPSVSVGGDIANPGKSQTDYQGEKASGQINGIPWIFTSGTAKPLPNDPSRMFLTLQNQDFADLCAASSFTNTRVVTSVPAQVGETTLGMVGSSFETVTFSYPAADGNDAHMIASESRIAITSITAEEVTGFIIARYDGANSINGAFKLKVCPR